MARRLCASGLTLCLVACARGEQPAERAIEIVVPTETATLDPRYSTRSLDIKVTRLVHAGLTGLNPDTLLPVPLVASSWHRPDALTVHVELKPNLRFHSGRPLHAADVCATLDALNDPALASPHRAVVRAFASCGVESARALTLKLSAPRASLLTDLEVPILRADQARSAPSPSGALDGLGPYRIARFVPGEVVLEPAQTGLLPRPAHSAVVRSVRDENARALRLLAGRSDIAPNAVSAALWPALEGHEGLSLVSRRGANVTYLLMQNDRDPFSAQRVRHAVARAIDRKRIILHLLGGRAELASSIFPPGHWSNPDVPLPVPYDPAAARAVLTGLRPITLLTSTERARVTIARAIAQMLEDAGLEVRVITLDLGILLARLDSGDFDLASLQMPELTEPNLLKWFFHPSAVPGEGQEGRNRARYRNPKAAELLDRAAVASSTEQRRALYGELAQLMATDLPVVPLWHEEQVALVSARACKFSLSAEGRWLALAGL
ncbi:MAG TPA: ABC transporter substrate-binding protein [Polyangiaceae bacterium]|nr:ABC transporter substrate-binding protein [Polyangiaceae bacterium]